MTRHKNIAVVAACPFPMGRGTPIRIRRLSEALARRGHQVDLVTYHLGDLHDEVPFAVHRTPNLAFYKCSAPGPTYTKLILLDPLLYVRLRQLLKQRKIDVIHAHHYEGLAVALAARGRNGPPIVYDAHTTLGGELSFYRMALPGMVKQWIAQALDRGLPPRADFIVTVSDEISETLLAAGIPTRRLAVIRNGVELESFTVAPADIPGRSTGPVLGFAGNLAPYQGVDCMLKAFRIVLQDQPGARLVIITDSSPGDLRQQAQAMGVLGQMIIVEASFDKVPALLKSADILLNPRLVCPGVPQKLLNYMAAGRPIVSFAGSGRILEHGKTGLLVYDNCPEGFARGLLQVIGDAELGRKLGTGAQTYAAQRLSWSVAAEMLETAFDAALAERSN